jgi:hypothetical protein
MKHAVFYAETDVTAFERHAVLAGSVVVVVRTGVERQHFF